MPQLGLFASPQQVREARNQQLFNQGAALAPAGFGGFTGQLFQGLANLGPQSDPRITLAESFAGKDLNSPEDLRALMVQANELGLQNEAFQLADRIRSVTPEAVEPTETFGDFEVLQEVDIDGVKHVVVGQESSIGGKAANTKLLKADEFRAAKDKGGKGGSGSGKNVRSTTVDINRGRAILEASEGFGALESSQLDALAPVYAEGVASLIDASDNALTEGEASELVVNALREESLVARNAFDIGDKDAINLDQGRATIAQLVREARTRFGTASASGGSGESPEIAQARAWLAANPNDPRAAQVRQRILESQGR